MLSTPLKQSLKHKENGVVYTPTDLSDFVAELVINFWYEDVFLHSNDKDSILKNLRVLDPACGEGELLKSTGRVLDRILKSGEKTKLDSDNIFCGIDIDDVAVSKSQSSIKRFDWSSTSTKNFLSTNALIPKKKDLNIDGWESVKKLFNAEEGFEILIANPPWGAETSNYDKELSKENFSLQKGQYDTSDIFIELAVSIVKQNGYFAFIIPDSLFSFERKELRKLLTENTEIKYIGRLGEKIFDGINRACAVVICKKVTPKPTNKVRCFRLNPKLRKSILSGEMSFAQADKKLAHYIQQKRFSRSPNFLFDIDTKDEEREVIDRISDSKTTIGKYVSSSRGVELSKTGKVCKCSKCHFWTPLPSSKNPKCSHCGSSIDLNKVETATIISKKRFKGSKPILVGESVRRYSITSRYWISTNNRGINYKSISLYNEPKILVRKTGVGITATIDYSSSLTNQVVYIFRQKVNLPEPVQIEFILAVMNSRAIYYYLLKKYGETEWRSHPYLTQSQILDLPIPDLFVPTAREIQSKVVTLLKPYLEKHEGLPSKIDAQVEYLIAKLFGLGKKDYEVIYKTLNDTQGLIPVKALASVFINDIFRSNE